MDTRAALILAYTAANLPIAVWLLRDVFAALPVELEDAARVDGASRLRVLAGIVLPLALPGLTATFLFLAVLSWNEYPLAVVLAGGDAQTMPAFLAGQMAIREQQATTELHWGYLSVLILIMVGPLVGLAWLLQRLVSRHFSKGHESQ